MTEEFYTLGKLVQLGLGTPNYDGNTTLCMSTAVSGYKRSFGSDGPPGTYEDLERADVIVLIGANIADNHPILCRRLEANPGTTLIVVDPRVTKTAMMADLHLPIRPRSDLALLNGLIHIVIERDLVDRDYIDSAYGRIRGAARLGARVHARAGGGDHRARPDELHRTAALYANARAAFIGWTMGVNHSSKGTETVNAINNLALITGNIGRAGAAPFSITGQCNAMGTREAGGASCLPGYRQFESAGRPRRDRRALERAGRADPGARGGSRIPTSSRRRSTAGFARSGSSAPIRSSRSPIWACCSRRSRGSTSSWCRTGSIPTPTSELAHLVLPAAVWGEKEGTYTNSERRVSKVNRAVDPPGDARPDFDILLDLAAALGVRDELFPGWSTPRDAFDEWKRVSAGRLCDYSGMTYEAIEQHGGIQWPFPAGRERSRRSRAASTPTGASRPTTGGRG